MEREGAQGMRTNDSLRIGDAERDGAITALARHFADGRLTQDEHEERAGRALKARTGADLRVLFSDLPRLDPPAPPKRRASGNHLLLTSMASALLVMAGVLLMLHLLPLIALIALVFFLARIFTGGPRGWSGRGYRPDWRDNPWHDRQHGGGFNRR
jgi:hypothetical protein